MQGCDEVMMTGHEQLLARTERMVGSELRRAARKQPGQMRPFHDEEASIMRPHRYASTFLITLIVMTLVSEIRKARTRAALHST
jgi:hypothetical protein